jgi:hypothetical protein
MDICVCQDLVGGSVQPHFVGCHQNGTGMMRMLSNWGGISWCRCVFSQVGTAVLPYVYPLGDAVKMSTARHMLLL